MESVLNLRVVIEHPEPIGGAEDIAKQIERELTGEIFAFMRPVRVTVTIQSAVVEKAGAMEITPSSEMLRLMGLR